MEAVLIVISVILIGFLGVASYFAFKIYQKLEKSKTTEVVNHVAAVTVTDEELELKIKKADERAKLRIEDAEKRAQEIEQRAREFADRSRKQENDTRNLITQKEKEVDDLQRKILEREKVLAERMDMLEKKDLKVEEKLKLLEDDKDKIASMRNDLEGRLEEVAGLSREDAKKRMFEELDEVLSKEKAYKIKQAYEEIDSSVDEKAKLMLIDAMQRAATDYTAEVTTRTIEFPSDEVKGRIIGKEGRNIKAFERLTGCELILDESPTYFVISGFDPLRREVAYNALKILMSDGRIHPGRIEEVVQKAKVDLAKDIRLAGEEIAFKAGFPNLSPEIFRLLGRFKYRYSYGQNQGRHILEVVNMIGNLAAELGLRVDLAKKCALFHDLGKVAPPEMEGAHPQVGYEMGKKLGLEEEVLNGMLAHHQIVPPICLESALTYIADAISGGRPGARFTSMENYLQRVRAIEEIARKNTGVKDAYAISAGRELRVFVNPEQVDDATTVMMARNIAKEIHDTQVYPGTVKITVIREKRVTDMAM
ncbi:MAG: ribonuclease Y [bacterium]